MEINNNVGYGNFWPTKNSDDEEPIHTIGESQPQKLTGNVASILLPTKGTSGYATNLWHISKPILHIFKNPNDDDEEPIHTIGESQPQKSTGNVASPPFPMKVTPTSSFKNPNEAWIEDLEGLIGEAKSSLNELINNLKKDETAWKSLGSWIFKQGKDQKTLEGILESKCLSPGVRSHLILDDNYFNNRMEIIESNKILVEKGFGDTVRLVNKAYDNKCNPLSENCKRLKDLITTIKNLFKTLNKSH